MRIFLCCGVRLEIAGVGRPSRIGVLCLEAVKGSVLQYRAVREQELQERGILVTSSKDLLTLGLDRGRGDLLHQPHPHSLHSLPRQVECSILSSKHVYLESLRVKS